MKRLLFVFSVVGLAAAAGGCSPAWLRPQAAETFPVVFPVPPTKEQVIGAVNANSARIGQLQAEATISVQGMPALRGDLAVERPRRFRLRAGLLGIPGTGVDLGSNDELFWIWMERNQPPGVYFVRHDQLARSAARRVIPIEPEWLIEALGIVQLDPAGIHEGPYQRVPGKIQLHSRVRSGQEEITKITVVHERYGWVLEQYLYDPQGRLIALSRSSQHRYYPQEGVTLPQHVEVQIAPGQSNQVALRIDVGTYRINQLSGDPDQLWSMPQPEGFPLIDMADPRFAPLAQMPPRFAPQRSYFSGSAARKNFRPRYRRIFR